MEGVGVADREVLSDAVLEREMDMVRVGEGVAAALRVLDTVRDMDMVTLAVTLDVGDGDGVRVELGDGGGVAHFHEPASCGLLVTMSGDGQVRGQDPTSALFGHVAPAVAAVSVSSAVDSSTRSVGQAVQSYALP